MLVRQTHACNSINFVINISTHFYFRGFLLLCTKEKSYKNIWKIVIKRILFLFKAGILQKDYLFYRGSNKHNDFIFSNYDLSQACV